MRDNLKRLPFINRLLQDRLLKQLVKNSGLMYSAGIVSIILTFVQQIATARGLGLVAYGQFATIMAIVAFMMLAADFRTWEAATKLLAETLHRNEFAESASIITWLSLIDLIAGLLSVLLLLPLTTLLADLFLNDPDLAVALWVYAISIPFRMITRGTPNALIRLYNRFDWLSAKSVIYAIVRLVLIAGPALLGWGLIGVIIGSLLSEIIHFLLVVFMTYRLWHQNSSEAIGLIRLQRPQRFHQGLRLVRQLWVSASIKGLQLETFVPLLALLTTPAQVGLYRGALDVAQLLARLTEPLQVVIQPTLMQIYQQQTLAVFTRYIRQITLILAGIVVPFLLVVLVFGPQLFAVVFGEEFVGIAPVTSILTVGYGITTMTLWIRPSVIALDRLHEQNIIGIIIFIYTIAALLVASDAGALGAALVMSSALTFYVILSLVVLWRQLRDEQQR